MLSAPRCSTEILRPRARVCARLARDVDERLIEEVFDWHAHCHRDGVDKDTETEGLLVVVLRAAGGGACDCAVDEVGDPLRVAGVGLLTCEAQGLDLVLSVFCVQVFDAAGALLGRARQLPFWSLYGALSLVIGKVLDDL